MPKFSGSPREPQESRLEEALDFLDTKVGACLLREGATLHRHTGSMPSNVWIESKTGRTLHHSNPGLKVCPFWGCWGLLQPYLEKAIKPNGEIGFALTPEIMAHYAHRKLSQNAKPPKSLKSPNRPRL